MSCARKYASSTRYDVALVFVTSQVGQLPAGRAAAGDQDWMGWVTARPNVQLVVYPWPDALRVGLVAPKDTAEGPWTQSADRLLVVDRHDAGDNGAYGIVRGGAVSKPASSRAVSPSLPVSRGRR